MNGAIVNTMKSVGSGNSGIFARFGTNTGKNLKRLTLVCYITNILAGSVSPGLDAPRVAGSFPNFIRILLFSV